MKKITFECELITPMFMYGGDGKTLELRPSEFKGMLRFWWRALYPNLSLSDLKKKEGDIFGNTSKKSSFRIKVEPIEEYTDKNITLRNQHDSGVNYFFYSMFLGVNKNKDFYKPSTKFSLTFIFNREQIAQEVLKSFWLLTYLSGVGSRNRRGAGNFQIINFIDNDNILSFVNLDFKIKNHISQFLKENLTKVTQLDNSFNKYINLKNFKMFIWNSEFDNWRNALNEVGIQLQNFRNRKEPDYTTVKEFILNGKTGEVRRPAFGLPLQFRYRSLNGKSAQLQGSNKDRSRSGSPLFIKLIKNNNSYIPILIFFEKKLFPDGDKIKISSKNQRKPQYLNVPDLSIIQEFIESLSNQSLISEVL